MSMGKEPSSPGAPRFTDDTEETDAMLLASSSSSLPLTCSPYES